jgi:hypothetical protein
MAGKGALKDVNPQHSIGMRIFARRLRGGPVTWGVTYRGGWKHFRKRAEAEVYARQFPSSPLPDPIPSAVEPTRVFGYVHPSGDLYWRVVWRLGPGQSRGVDFLNYADARRWSFIGTPPGLGTGCDYRTDRNKQKPRRRSSS